MKLVQINTVCNGSTGRIMADIQKKANEDGFETISFYGRRKAFKDLKCEKIGNPISFWIHVFITTLFDKQGHGSYFYTKKLVKRLKEENPDIIHLHNIHGYYLNIPVLFKYLKEEYKGKLFWTFHDCWPFTGHCPYFTTANCNKWQKQCYKCPNKKIYPISLFKDNSYNNYLEKKNLFTNLNNLTIITPSDWLNKLVKKSFLKDYNVITVNNGIDLSVFKPTIDNNIKLKYNIPDNKKILLGVASVWEERKGLDDFLNLSRQLSNEYVIILVGLTKKQIKSISKYKNIIGIERTEDIGELVKLYSISNIYINPSKEETFSMTTLEAIACGTPVIVLDTSAVKELVNNDNGIILSNNEINYYIKEIDMLVKQKSRVNNQDYLLKYEKNNKYEELIKLYK